MKKNETPQTTEPNVPRETSQMTKNSERPEEEAHKTLERQKKERGDSPTYTIKSFGKVIKKMQKAKMVTEQEYLQLSQLHKNVVQRWISIGLEL